MIQVSPSSAVTTGSELLYGSTSAMKSSNASDATTSLAEGKSSSTAWKISRESARVWGPELSTFQA
jgi:hypothetical protein